ncbi:unnamed protein product [Agarophyton chilense]
MNTPFTTSTSLDTAVATSTTLSAPLESSDHLEDDQSPASHSHNLEEVAVSSVQSIEKLEHGLVSEVESHLVQLATASSPKRPCANETVPSVVIPTISEVVGTSAIPNGVEDIDPEHNHISNHVQLPIVVSSAADPSDCRAVTNGRTETAQTTIPVSAELPPSLQLETAVPVHTVALTVDPTAVHQPNALSDLMPAASTAHTIIRTSEMHTHYQPSSKKKRKTYSTEEERRQARILKNRRTAEESRQRRLKRMKELEDIAAKAETRERELIEEIRLGKEQLQEAAKLEDSLRTALQEKDAEIAQKDSQLTQKEIELAEKHEEVERLHEKLALK